MSDKSSKPESGARFLAVAAPAFLLPLLIFFGWFFWLRAQSFSWVLAALLLLAATSVFVSARFASRLAKIGATWLFTGCVAALFWALLIKRDAVTRCRNAMP